jgi:predicted murein hydrolase (TIGR00659 family)
VSRLFIAISMSVFTVVVYLVMNRLYRRFQVPFLIPTLTTTLTIIVMLVAFQLPYNTYMIGGQWINHLLGPAIVSLAYPLYKQRDILTKNLVPVLGGIIVGSIVGIMSGILFAQSLGFTKNIIISLIPKSITIPVAMQIASELGGMPSLAAAFVMVAGFTGAIFGPYVFKWFRIHSFLGQGIALGSASHALGIAKAFEYGENTVSISSVAMTLSAVTGSIIGPFIVWLVYSK